MTEKKIKVGPVCSYSLPIVIEREDRPIWERNPSNALSPSIVTILILVYVVPEMDYLLMLALECVLYKISIKYFDLRSRRSPYELQAGGINRLIMGTQMKKNPTGIAIRVEEAEGKV